MNILIPVLGFGRSGGYRVLSKLADELIKLNHHVCFLSPDVSNVPYFPTKATVLWINNNGSIGDRKATEKEATFFLYQKQLLLGLLKIDLKSFDVIVCNHSLTTIPLKLAGLTSKTLYYVQAYEPDYFSELPGLKNKIFGALSAWSYKMNLFTVVNAKLYLHYKRLTATRYLYPGVDFNYFYPLNTLSDDNEIITIGTIGRKEKFKGTMEVYHAFRELKKKYVNLRLKIAFGNPDDFPDMEFITCVNPHGDEALAAFYQSLDYYFCAGSSQLGAFHYPVVEAMSCGIPLITTNYYPANQTNAWVIRPNNHSDFISQFEIANNNTFLKQEKVMQALKDVQEFDWKEVGRKFSNFIIEKHNTIQR